MRRKGDGRILPPEYLFIIEDSLEDGAMKEISSYNGDGNYYSFCENETQNMLKEHLNEDGSLNEESVRELRERTKDEYFFSVPADKEALEHDLKERIPGALITDENVINERKNLRTDLCKKIFRYSFNRSETLLRYPQVTNRTLKGLIFPGDDEASVRKNERFMRVMSTGTPEEQKEILSQKIEEIGNWDLSSIDFTDDKAFVENIEKILTVRYFADPQNVIKDARDIYGIDFTEPRFANFCKNCAVMSPLWGSIGSKINIMTAATYDFVDCAKLTSDDYEPIESIPATENSPATAPLEGHAMILTDNPDFLPNQDLLNKSLSVQERFDKAKEDIGDIFHTVSNMEKRKNEKRPDDKELRHALNDFSDNYLHTNIRNACDSLLRVSDPDYAETKTARIARVVAVYDLLLQQQTSRDDRSHFNDELLNQATDAYLNDPTFLEMVNTLNNDDIDEIAFGNLDKIDSVVNTIDIQIKRNTKLREAGKAVPHAAFDHRPVPDKKTDPVGYYMRKLNDNIDIIRQYDPTFSMTEEQKRAIVNPERIAMHERAKNIAAGMLTYEGKPVPNCYVGKRTVEFARIQWYLIKRGGTEEDKAFNEELFNKLPAHTAEGDAFRKKLFIDTMNELNAVDPDMFSKAHTEQEIFDYCCDNYARFQISFELTNISSNLVSDGYGFTEAGKAKFDAQFRYLADVASSGMNVINHAADEDFLTFPSELINARIADAFPGAQKNLELMTNDSDKKFSVCAVNTLSLDVLKDDSINARLKKNTDAGVKHYSLDDLEDKSPLEDRVVDSLPNLRDKFAAAYKTLKNADNFYNLQNSTQYKNMLTALSSAVKTFGSVKGEIKGADTQKIYNAVKDVLDASDKYSKYAKPLKKDVNRQTRYDTATKLITLCKLITKGTEASELTDAAADKDFCLFVKTANEKALEKTADEFYNRENLSEREQIFNRGVEKTNAERAKIATFPEGSTARDAQQILVDARDELTNLIGRKQIDTAAARLLMAKVVACSQLAGDDLVPTLPANVILASAQTVAANKNFIALTKKIDSDTINKFLGDGGAEKLTAKYTATLLAAQKNRGHRQNNVNPVNKAPDDPSLD